MGEEISSKLFSDLHDAVEECEDEEEEEEEGSSNLSRLEITFDINHLTEVDADSSTVLYFLERAAPGLKKKTLQKVLRNMTHLTKYSSVIVIGRDGDEDDLEVERSIVEIDDLMGGLISSIPFQVGKSDDIENIFREELYTMLEREGCGTMVKRFQQTFQKTSRLHFLVNERAPYIPNQVAAQTLANILEETLAGSTEPVALLVLAKLQYLEGSESQNETQPSKKKRRQANESSMTANLRKVQFVKPEEELFVPFQDSVQKVGEDFMVSSKCESFVFRSTSDNPTAYDDFFVIPMIVPLSGQTGHKSNSPTAAESLIEKLRSFES
ncbi:integrase [Perkinsela sp. CCAP 1560/4]|nr:integrase [Perkinsela sp. CCAP 1560/4]|eukprot:KNH05878.1 integrase [Perkinsela sp. CCAP 1560/4]